MTILDEMTESLYTDSPVFIDFLYRFDPKKKQIFAFYEGDEDSSYYQKMIKNVMPKDYELEELVAGCKNNVLKLWREFDWSTYDRHQMLFFVDKDLSFWLGEPQQFGENVFVTDEYSVENYVVSQQSFEIWLRKFEGFARAKKAELDSMVNTYSRLEIGFNEQMIHIMAAAIVAKRHDNNINLSDYKLGKHLSYEVRDGSLECTLSDDRSYLSKWHLSDSDSDEIAKQIKTIHNFIGHYSVRGKWILWFLAETGEYMRKHANLFAPSLKSEGKIPPTCSVATSQCLSVLAPYCDNPSPRLVAFLSRTCGALLCTAS